MKSNLFYYCYKLPNELPIMRLAILSTCICHYCQAYVQYSPYILLTSFSGNCLLIESILSRIKLQQLLEIFQTLFTFKCLPKRETTASLRPSMARRLRVEFLNFKILTKRSFRISTKNNLDNLNQRSAERY